MAAQMVFDRHEIKYLLTLDQRDRLLKVMEGRMALDRFGRSTIRNLYYDTDSFRLIRRSLEKPVYKEKLRLRSYQRATGRSEVFVEMKKKYRSVVYKRRAALTEERAMAWLSSGILPDGMGQIEKEIEYFRCFYGTLAPKMFISAEREAFYDLGGSDFRLTLDEEILARTDRLSLREEPDGTELLPPGTTLMELKTAGAFPLWMTDFLTRERIFPGSFSKYGTAYARMIQNGKGMTCYDGNYIRRAV